MSNLKDFVSKMEVKEFKKIEEFDKIPTDIDVNFKIIDKKDPKPDEEPTFNIYEAKIGDVSVRVPKEVLNQLKVQLEAKPDLKFFKVRKDGTGMNTKYTVITLE